MKLPRIILAIAAAVVGIVTASAKPVPVTITFTNDNNFPGYVTHAKDDKLYVS